MRLAYAIIIVSALLVAMTMSGCVCCSNIPGGNGPSATVTPTPSGSLPKTPAELNDLNYLWNNVHYLKQSSSIVSTVPDMNGQETTMTWRLSNGNYKGQPALKLTVFTNSSADKTKVNNSFGFNIGYDVYFSKAGNILTMLGGYAYMQLGDDPEDIMQGEINVSEMVEDSKITGSTDPVTGEYITEKGPARFSPVMDLSRPLAMDSIDQIVSSVESGYDINTLMSASAVQYQGLGNVTLTPAGRETLKVGQRNIDCYIYTWTVKLGEGQADYKVWYSPEFPATPLKTVANLNNGQTIQTSKVDEWS